MVGGGNMAQESRKSYDVIILGGGPAGLTAGIYTSRARLSTLLVEHALIGGQMATTEQIENYPGFPLGIGGDELSRQMEEQARRFGADIVNREIVDVQIKEELKEIKTAEATYVCKALIVCTGAEYRKLGIPGEKEFRGRGVSYCATCDGAFFRDSKVVVVGGGDSALTEAIFLTKFAKELTIIHRRDALRATKIYQERAFANSKIKFLWESVVHEIKGDQIVKSILVRNVRSGKLTEFETEGVFLFVGLEPRTEFLRGRLQLDEGGYIITDENCETSVKGVLAAGDCRKKTLRQIATAVGDGATAAFAAERYLEGRG